MKISKNVKREFLKKGIPCEPQELNLSDIFAILGIILICSLAWVGV
jgi:hypothetical protein